jgi:hypothetical protein
VGREVISRDGGGVSDGAGVGGVMDVFLAFCGAFYIINSKLVNQGLIGFALHGSASGNTDFGLTLLRHK